MNIERLREQKREWHKRNPWSKARWVAKNQEKVREYKRKSRQKEDPEVRRAIFKRWYEKHKVEFNAKRALRRKGLL